MPSVTGSGWSMAIFYGNRLGGWDSASMAIWKSAEDRFTSFGVAAPEPSDLLPHRSALLSVVDRLAANMMPWSSAVSERSPAERV